MDFRKAYAIAIKDLDEVFSSVGIYGPMLGVPMFFSVLLPVLTFYVTQYSAQGIVSKLVSLPGGSGVLGSGPGIFFMAFFSVSVLGPIFLTMPILTASVIASDSFAGEKERKTAEALLATPIKTSELLLGKILASFIPTVLLTVAVFAIYGAATNILAFRSFGQYILPTGPWIMMLLTSPFLAIAAISFVVLISSHVKSIKEAQQISTLLVLPILIMPFAAILNIVELSVSFFVWFISFLFLLDVVALYIGIKSFRKENIL
ncbi:MAG: ABC transporter permease [Candidatus Micrarchaeota archaeon]|nr:ABC transporter permease [Candidatus Micrarchaeota archaeon]